MNINNTNRWYGKKAGIEQTLNSWSTIMNAVDHNSPDRLAIDKIIKTLNIKSNGDDHPFIKNNDRVLDSLSKQSNEALLTILTTFTPSGDGDDFNKLVILYAEFQDRVSGNKTVKEFEAQFVQKSHDVMGHDNNQMTNETTLHHKNIGLTASKNDGFFIRRERGSDFMSDGIKIPPGRSRCYFEGTFKGSHPISGFIRSLDQNNLSERRVCFDGFDSTIGIITYPDGSEYKGEIEHFQPHGQGVLTRNKTHCIGDFENGEFIYGNIKYSNGRIYEGEIEHFQPHGLGEIIETRSFDNRTMTIRMSGAFDQGELKQVDIVTCHGVYLIGCTDGTPLSIEIYGQIIDISKNLNENVSVASIQISDAYLYENVTREDIEKIKRSLKKPIPEYVFLVHEEGSVEKRLFYSIHPTIEFIEFVKIAHHKHPTSNKHPYAYCVRYLTSNDIEMLEAYVV